MRNTLLTTLTNLANRQVSPLKRHRSALLAASLVSGVTAAHAGLSISAPTSGPFQKFGEWLQAFVNFIDGPFGLAVVAISIVIAFAVWVFAPKEGIVGPVLRIVVAGIAILNVAALVASFQ